VLVGAACSDPPPAANPPKVSTAGSATRSATPTPTTPEQEVEAAVRAYYAELTRAAQTNDTTRLKQMIDRNCPCYGTVRALEAATSRGERTPDVEIRLRSVSVHDVIEGTSAAEVLYEVNSYNLLGSDGEVLNRVPARADHVDLSLIRTASRWIVANTVNLGE
jgi:dihydropteroate synthase